MKVVEKKKKFPRRKEPSEKEVIWSFKLLY
jgi:hypothetical protein